jgi:type VI secretion system protein ImpK
MKPAMKNHDIDILLGDVTIVPSACDLLTIQKHLAQPSLAKPVYRNSPHAEPLTRAVKVSGLLDAMVEGFYLLFLLRSRHAPAQAQQLRSSLDEFLRNFEHEAHQLNTPQADIYLCKYAYCATIDECIARSQFNIKPEWQKQPLQLIYFDELCAGERFFEILEAMRQQGAARLQVLEVLHMCLLLGFTGKYATQGPEKLGYISARVAQEIAIHQGGRAPFAPYALAPDHIKNTLKTRTPAWAVTAVFAALAALAYCAIGWHLSRTTEQHMATYNHIVNMPPPVANVQITLP